MRGIVQEIRKRHFQVSYIFARYLLVEIKSDDITRTPLQVAFTHYRCILEFSEYLNGFRGRSHFNIPEKDLEATVVLKVRALINFKFMIRTRPRPSPRHLRHFVTLLSAAEVHEFDRLQ
jgi:hypothetical protein